MKNNIIIILAMSIFFAQCTDDLEDYSEDAQNGGLITSSQSSQNYVVGNDGTYSFDMNLFQNAGSSIQNVNLYKSAVIKDADGVGQATNEILTESIEVGSSEAMTIYSGAYSYADLIDELTVNGEALPASDSELSIGDVFLFKIESVMSDGRTVVQDFNIEMAVSTRFAGRYLSTAMSYYRLGVESPSYWLGEELVVKSIDASTYKYEWGTIIGWTGPLYFQVDADGNITYPKEWDGAPVLLNDEPLITCNENLADLASVPCEGTNFVIKDDVNGKDQLVLTYGYYTGGSGPREFHETLTKIVD